MTPGVSGALSDPKAKAIKERCNVKRSVVIAGLVAMSSANLWHCAVAQEYPVKPVRLIVPQNPGGIADSTGRLLAKHFSEVWSQPVVVENKPGGSAMIGAAFVARAPADGYTLLLGVPSLSIFNAILKNPEINAEKDLAPVSQIVATPMVIAVNAALPVSNLAELVMHARANPGKLNYGSSGGAMTLVIEYFKEVAGIDLYRVSYTGESQAVPALATNDVQVVFATPVALGPMIQAGKVKAIATTSASFRIPAMPQVPTSVESGLKGYDVIAWLGLFAPANTPAPIRRKLADEVGVFARKPEVIAQSRSVGNIPVGSTPEEFAALVSAENRRWSDVARRAGVEKQ